MTTTVLKKPSFIQFGLLDGTEILKFCRIPITKVYTKEMTDLDGTLYDDKLGVIGNDKECVTCGNNNMLCPGHFGYISLEEPVYNYKYSIHVRNILSCVCWDCGECRIPRELYEIRMPKGLHRLAKQKALIKMCKAHKHCHNDDCGSILKKCKVLDGKLRCQEVQEDKEFKVVLNAAKAYNILVKVKPETMLMMGYNEDLSPNPVFLSRNDVIEDQDRIFTHIHAIKPTSFIFTILPVLPPCARPWVMDDDDKRNDKLTNVYNDILNTNINLGEAKKGKIRRRKKDINIAEFIEKCSEILELYINSLIDNHKERDEKKFFTKRLPHIGLQNRIEKKKGRIQSNVNGKHTDFCARNVIASGHTLIRSGYVGIPEDTMKKLTKPHVVADYNYNHMCKLLHKGLIESVKRNGKLMLMSFATAGYTRPFILKNGDIVDVQLQNGDYIFFGRQPTLRQESALGVKVQRTTNHPFRLPLSMCTPLNADQRLLEVSNR